jgi:hypothetical protein
MHAPFCVLSGAVFLEQQHAVLTAESERLRARDTPVHQLFLLFGMISPGK